MLNLSIMPDTCVRRIAIGRWVPCLRMALVFAGFFAVAVALHYPGFHSRMIYDTEALLQGNAHVFSRHDIREVIAITPSRSLFMTSLYVNYLATGLDACSFRVVNAAILAAAGLALTLLIWVLLETSSLARQLSDAEKHCLSIVVGLIFVVHPLQRLVVLYIWQREAIMACVFLLLRAGRVCGRTLRDFRESGALVCGHMHVRACRNSLQRKRDDVPRYSDCGRRPAFS